MSGRRICAIGKPAAPSSASWVSYLSTPSVMEISLRMSGGFLTNRTILLIVLPLLFDGPSPDASDAAHGPRGSQAGMPPGCRWRLILAYV